MSIPVGHNGTISQFLFMCYKGDELNQPGTGIKAITLEATSNLEGNFAILNNVTPGFLEYREARARGIIIPDQVAGILMYDPAAGLYKDELTRNSLTIGCADLTDMTLRFDFASSDPSIDRIEVWIDVDYNLIQPLGEHVRIDRLTEMVPSVGGKIEITELPRMDRRYGYHAIHIGNPMTDPSNGIFVDEVTVIVNGQQYPYRDVPVSVINQLAALQGRIQPDTNFQTIDFNKEDLANYFLPAGMNEFKVIPNFKKIGTHAGGSTDVWYELVKKA